MATRGRWLDELPACIQCHGGDGGGVGANFPPLVGQPASYISNQLRAWQNGQRDPGPLGLMGAVAKKLSERDVAAVAGYFGSSADELTMPVSSAGPDRGAPPARSGVFLPPAESAIPDNEYGNMLRLGERVFDDPGEFASAYVGNELRHPDAARSATGFSNPVLRHL